MCWEWRGASRQEILWIHIKDPSLGWWPSSSPYSRSSSSLPGMLHHDMSKDWYLRHWIILFEYGIPRIWHATTSWIMVRGAKSRAFITSRMLISWWVDTITVMLSYGMLILDPHCCWNKTIPLCGTSIWCAAWHPISLWWMVWMREKEMKTKQCYKFLIRTTTVIQTNSCSRQVMTAKSMSGRCSRRNPRPHHPPLHPTSCRNSNIPS